ncbi:MAG: F510_1955 family glycosylhydrolase [Solirubrobacterales bacterium]
MRISLIVAVALVFSLVVSACGKEGSALVAPVQPAAHVHGLGLNPADQSLYIATHDGLFRAAENSETAERVGASHQDTMGFTVRGANDFLGSGHPGPGQSGTPHLGLIESDDAGESWEEVSLSGEADFHVLRYAEGRIYGFNAYRSLLMSSDDDGASWRRQAAPQGLIDFTIDPENPDRILLSTETGLAAGDIGGERFRPLQGEVGFVAWPEADSLYVVDGLGGVHMSTDGGKEWGRVGEVGGQPVAFTASETELTVAGADGTIFVSSDGGRDWEIRARL